MRGAKSKVTRPAKKSTRPSQGSSPPPTRYLFFGGKGGVGKTTAAAASALFLLDAARSNEQLLLFSTDPAHSLSDSFGEKIGDRLFEVARNGKARLLAFEMNATVALEKFRLTHRGTLAEIADRGTLLDDQDINELLNLSLPGMDEIMALFELSELDLERQYSRIIVDTAPSGHTSRLLRLPAVFSRMVTALDRMADKHRYLVAHFARGAGSKEDEVDVFIRDLTERINRVRTMLHDDKSMSFTLVTIPETMSVEETVRYHVALHEEGIPVGDLIINRVEQEHAGCNYCHARVASQKTSLEVIADRFASLRIHNVPLFPDEVRGLDGLRRFGRLVWDGHDDLPNVSRAAAAKRTTPSPASAKLAAPAAIGFVVEPRKMLIFGGKGGVGKTTSAAATALALAKLKPRDRILIFSIDPAHSLSDSFDETIGELRRGVAGLKNLDAMEIDPGARFEELKSRYQTWTDELFESLGGGSRLEVQFDREAMRDLVSLAPPGIDEIAALSAISDLVDENHYQTIVLDTAPTGHLVRFLELPEVALSWVRTFIRLLLKYQNVVRSTGVAEELIALSKNIKRVIALLTTSDACEFIGVAIPESMSLRETERLAPALKRLKVPMRHLLINGVLPAQASTCSFCSARSKSQLRVLEEFQRTFIKGIDLFEAPQQPHDIRGSKQLEEYFSTWHSLSGSAPAGARPNRRSTRAALTAGTRKRESGIRSK